MRPIPLPRAPSGSTSAREALTTSGDYLAFDDGERVHVVPLQEGWTRIGRSLSAHVRFDDPTVSRRHALLYRDAEQARVLDDRSLNGVFRNGSKVDLAELERRRRDRRRPFPALLPGRGPGSARRPPWPDLRHNPRAVRSLTARWAAGAVLACLALALLSLLTPSVPTTDPWGWIVWGREVAHLDLDTSQGGSPSWKPLPVLFTTPLAIFGDALPEAWLVVARAGGLFGLVLVVVLAVRLAGDRRRAIAVMRRRGGGGGADGRAPDGCAR